MPEQRQPRAGIWTGAISGPVVDMEEVVDRSRRALQSDLVGTGLFLVGRPVVEGCDPQKGMRLSWKVFSGPYPSEENEHG